MENYKKGKNVEEELSKEQIPIEMLTDKFLWMHVKGGTKVTNVIEFAQNAFKSGEYRTVVWSGSGGGVPKTISCAEIMKRELKLHQITRLAYQKIDEYWDPALKGLDQIVVTRRVPAVHILLSLDEIDPKTQGYQTTNIPTKFWPIKTKQNDDDDYVFRNKKNSNNRNHQNRSKFQKDTRDVAAGSSKSNKTKKNDVNN